MSYLLGLTGGIGMGKTTTAALFAARGVPVWDADAAVHRLYGPGGAAVGPVGRLFSAALGPQGIDRGILRALLAAAPDRLRELEAVVHPLVAADRAAGLDDAVALEIGADRLVARLRDGRLTMRRGQAESPDAVVAAGLRRLSPT